MTYFERLAAFAQGQFVRAEAQIQEFIPLGEESTLEPLEFTSSDRPGSNRPAQVPTREVSPKAVPSPVLHEQTHHHHTHHEAVRTETQQELGVTVEQPTHFHRQEIHEGDRALTIRQEHNQLLVAIRNEFKAGLACQHHDTVILAGTSGLETRPPAPLTPVTRAPSLPTRSAPAPLGRTINSPAPTTISPPSEPEIHIHIGRIDVKVPPVPAREEPVREKPKGVISLEEYLAQRRAS